MTKTPRVRTRTGATTLNPERFFDILDKHFANLSLVNKRQIVACIMMGYSLGADLFGLSVADDVELLDAIEGHLISAARSVEGLSSSTLFALVNASGKSEGPIQQRLYRLSSDFKPAIEAARKTASVLAPSGKTDWQAAAVAEQCRVVWEDILGNVAPTTIRAEKLEEGEPVTGPFGHFITDVFKFLGLETEAFSALRALKRADLFGKAVW